jgi:hypothetical protein
MAVFSSAAVSSRSGRVSWSHLMLDSWTPGAKETAPAEDAAAADRAHSVRRWLSGAGAQELPEPLLQAGSYHPWHRAYRSLAVKHPEKVIINKDIFYALTKF